MTGPNFNSKPCLFSFWRRPHVFVGNLPAELDEDTFRETMEGGGEVPLSQFILHNTLNGSEPYQRKRNPKA